MSVDPSQMSQSAVTQPSATPGSVAPPSVSQAHQVTPGAGQPVQGSQPASQPQQPVAQGAQPAPQPVAPRSVPDPERLREQAELNQYRQLMGQLATRAQQEQENSELDNRLTMITARAETMPVQEANTFLKEQMRQIAAQKEASAAQRLQQREQEFAQRERMLVAPQYADYLIETLGLPAEAKQEFLALGDPDLMQRYSGVIKQRYDSWNQRISQYENNQVQMARSQEVQAQSAAGLGSFGGQTAGGSMQIEVPDDPDERAMAVLAALEGRPGNYRQV
jgi:hypothetical protein